MSKWEVDVDNKLKAYTLLEWGVAVGEPYHVMLRIGYAMSRWEWDTYKDTDRSPHQFQTAMSPTAARELELFSSSTQRKWKIRSLQRANRIDPADVRLTALTQPSSACQRPSSLGSGRCLSKYIS